MPSLSKFLLDTNEQHRQELRVRNKWMIRVRWFYLILLPSVATVATILTNENRRYIKLYIVVGLVGLGLNGLLWFTTTVKSASVRYYQIIALIQVVLDLCLASSVIFSQKGVESRATVLYAVPIVVAGVLFRRPGAYITGILSGLAYAGSVIGAAARQESTASAPEIWVPVVFYPCIFILLAALIARFSAINAIDEQEKSYRELLALLRHQLHHPTSVIAATAEMLEYGDNYKNWTIQEKEYLRQITRENMRLNSMITNILESASEPQDEPTKDNTPVDLVILLNDSATNCAMTARRITDLKTNLPNLELKIYGQAQQLRTAFDNVIENAFRYSNKGTPVTVGLTYDEPSGHITITVQDEGKGMSGSDQKRLFHLFTQLEERAVAEGPKAEDLYSLGLGLYVSKVILARHHGKLHLTSKEGEGTTVTIKIQEELWRRPEFFT